MATRATELKYLRRILETSKEDFLVASDMDYYHDQFFYKYEEETIFFAEIGVTGGLPDEFWKSLTCTMHIYYRDYPGYKSPPEDKNGKKIPTYRQSRLSFGMDRTLKQEHEIELTGNASLKYNRSFWLIPDDESNLGEVLSDMAKVIKDVGLPMVNKQHYSRQVMLTKV